MGILSLRPKHVLWLVMVDVILVEVYHVIYGITGHRLIHLHWIVAIHYLSTFCLNSCLAHSWNKDTTASSTLLACIKNAKIDRMILMVLEEYLLETKSYLSNSLIHSGGMTTLHCRSWRFFCPLFRFSPACSIISSTLLGWSVYSTLKKSRVQGAYHPTLVGNLGLLPCPTPAVKRSLPSVQANGELSLQVHPSISIPSSSRKGQIGDIWVCIYLLEAIDTHLINTELAYDERTALGSRKQYLIGPISSKMHLQLSWRYVWRSFVERKRVLICSNWLAWDVSSYW